MIEIEPARIDDEAFIVSLARRLAEPAIPPWRTRDEIVNGTIPHLRAALREGQSARSSIFIARENGRALGFVWTVMIEDFYGVQNVAKVSEIAVSKDSVGIGRTLMGAAESWARARGCSLLTLNVLQGNQRARAFYEKLGFLPEHINFAKQL